MKVLNIRRNEFLTQKIKMLIEYINEYGAVICKEDADSPPLVGDNIRWIDKSFRIISRVYHPTKNKWEIWISYE